MIEDGQVPDAYYKKRISYRSFHETFEFDVGHTLFSSFQIDEGSDLLLRLIDAATPTRILDLGCGWGVLGVVLARRFPATEVVMADRDLLAVRYANHNAALNATANARAVGSVGVAALPAGDYDLIVANIPAKIGDGAIEQEFVQRPLELLRPGGEYWFVVVSGLNRLMPKIGVRRQLALKEIKKRAGHTVYRVRKGDGCASFSGSGQVGKTKEVPMIYTDPVAVAPAFVEAIRDARRILLLSHVNPDGDAIGSMLGLYHALRAAGKEAVALAASELPHYTANLPGIEHVAVFAPGQPLPDSDIAWLVDASSLNRVGSLRSEHGTALAARPLLIVDHHIANSGEGALNLIQPAAASCAELLFRLLQAMPLPITAEAATCLLMGVYTDTQSFQTSSVKPETLRAAADLIAVGANHQAIIQAIYFQVPPETVRLTALALSELQQEGGLFWAVVRHSMKQKSGANSDAVDDTVIRMQHIAGMQALVLFKEQPDGSVKISLRSQPNIDVAQIAQEFGGGGHRQAAGATLHMNLEAALNRVLPRLRTLIVGE
jgi:bifunctional oligoribonuclease and PAP phosphatase NrnA